MRHRRQRDHLNLNTRSCGRKHSLDQSSNRAATTQSWHYRTPIRPNLRITTTTAVHPIEPPWEAPHGSSIQFLQANRWSAMRHKSLSQSTAHARVEASARFRLARRQQWEPDQCLVLYALGLQSHRFRNIALLVRSRRSSRPGPFAGSYSTPSTTFSSL
jgi:hypothetical protein